MIYYRLNAYMSITNERIFKNVVFSDCLKAKLVDVASGFITIFHVEKKINVET